MLTKIEQDALFRIAREIGHTYNHSGGDCPIHELYDKAIEKHRLSHEQAQWLDTELIKMINLYRGRQNV